LTAFSIIIGVSVMVIGEFIITSFREELNLSNNRFWIYLIMISRWIIIIMVYFITTSLLYRYGPANSKKWRLFSAGSWLATILAILSTVAFSYYINNFGAYNKLY